MLGLGCFCVLHFTLGFSVKVKLTVALLCVRVHFAWKDHPEMTYTFSGRMLNPTHSLMHCTKSIIN